MATNYIGVVAGTLAVISGMVQRRIAWNWADAGHCALCALPSGLVILTGDANNGLAWAVGILPAAIIGMAPARRDRSTLVGIGGLFAISIMIGSVLSQAAVRAVAGIFFIAYGCALLASRMALGQVAIALCAPVAAIGLSYPKAE
jgi:hypothetical protein